jgi:nucleoside-diphosphate-sugar epimerase
VILVTGCAGFVGSNLCNHLKRPFLGIDNLQFGYKENLNKEVNWITLNFNDIVHCINEFDILVHLACANIIYAQNYHIETFKTNALDTIKLFQRFKGKIIYTSTSSIYGNADKFPTLETSIDKVSNAYDQSKLIAELFLKQRGNYTTLRLSNVYGKNQRPNHPYSGVIGKFIGQAKENKPMTVFAKGTSTRDYTYVKDVVSAIEKAIDLPALNTEINIGTGVETDTIDLAHLISDLMDKVINVDFYPARTIDGIKRRCLDISKAKELLKWEPEYSLKMGLKEMIKNF